jgi:methylmalonyl-CoA/ethylmalonyl-CoA epimerase
MIATELAYVALVSNDVAATCTVFEQLLGLPRTDLVSGATGDQVPVFAVGRSALAVFPVGDPLVGGEQKPGVHHIALGVSRPQDVAQTLAALGVGPVAPHSAPGLGGRAVLAIARDATCGVRTVLTEPLELKPHSPGLIERIDHLGVASGDVNAADQVFSRKLGFEVESRQTDMEVSMAVESFTSDKYGVVYHTRKPEPVGGLRVIFITVGDCELEFLANFDPHQGAVIERGQPGNTRQDQGAITRFVQSRGQGLHHIALKSADIDATLAVLGAAGVPLIDLKGRPGSRRALIGFVHPKGLGGVLMHIVERP